jgi:hypothetical protein
MQGMEQLQLFENKRPTIKAKILFQSDKPVCYLTPQAIARDLTSNRSKCEQVDVETKLFIDQHDQPLLNISEQSAINPDLILKECLTEIEANKILDECFDEFQTNNQEVVESTHVRGLYSRHEDLDRHGNECTLL